ncbi:MAG: YncE family protein [Thermoplasmata archaeon]|nr:YncE family protein [Thermoplasmata archaeon]
MPSSILFDQANGYLYVRGSAGIALSVVDGATNTVLTSLPTGYVTSDYETPTVINDSSTGNLYATNPGVGTVSVINGSTNQITGNFSAPPGVTGLVLDPANGELYATDYGSAMVSVFVAATGQPVTNIPVGTHPEAMLFDPATNKVFVSNFGNGNVSVISTTTNKVVANPHAGLATSEPVALVLDTVDDYVDVVNSLTSNVTVIDAATNLVVATVAVGLYPGAAAYATSDDTLYVANGAGNTVSAISQATNTLTHTIGIGHGAQGAVYDPHNGNVYTVNYGSNNVSILSTATNSSVGSVTTNNFPFAIAFDPTVGNLFVANEGTSNVEPNLTVISGATERTIASIPLAVDPYGLTSAANGNLYAVDYAGNDTYVINQATNHVTHIGAAGYLPKASAFDPATGELYVITTNFGSDTVTVLTATGAPVTNLTTASDPVGITFDAANGDFYVSSAFGSVTVIDGATNTVGPVITIKANDILGPLLYDPHSLEVYATDDSGSNVSVINGTTIVKSIPVGTTPSGLAFDSANDTVFVANYGSSNMSVISDRTNSVVASLSAYFARFLAYDSGTNAIYMTSDENGQVTAFDASTYASLGPSLNVQGSIRSEGLAYDPANGAIYISNVFDSSISILSTAATYPVTFVASGLTPGTLWTVTLNGSLNSSHGTDIGFVEPSGSYVFSVGTVTGFTANVTGGPVVVSGAPRTVDIGFTAVGTSTYSVSFLEIGLTQGTPWTVTLVSTPGSSSTNTIVFSGVRNGSYSYTVGVVAGFGSSPSSGSVLVAGAPRLLDINFTTSATSLAAHLSASPPNFTLGASTTLTTSLTGGSGPFSYLYSQLPTGCSSLNATSLSCTPTATGTFEVRVTVTDATGAKANGTAEVTVKGSSTNPGSSSSNGSPLLYYGLGAVVILVLLVLLFLLLGRRRRKDASSAQTPATPPGGAGPPSSPIG